MKKLIVPSILSADFTKLEEEVRAVQRSGADWIHVDVMDITVQVEACRLLYSTVTAIKSYGVMAGVALSPGTPISSIEEILPYVDLILIMTVEPGFAEQKFINSMIPKIKRLRCETNNSAYKPLIEVDGGIKLDNIREVAQAGADVFVSGSGIFKTEDYALTIQTMRKEIESKYHDGSAIKLITAKI